MLSERPAPERIARSLAHIAVTKGMGEAGVMACNPKYISEKVDAIWKDYLFYLKPEYFSLVPVIANAVQRHPDGLAGLTKDIEAAWKEHQKTLPEIDF